MTTVTIKNRVFTRRQAAYLLRHIGWAGEVEAYLGQLDDGLTFSRLESFKSSFREYRRRSRYNRTCDAWKRAFAARQSELIERAYEKMDNDIPF